VPDRPPGRGFGVVTKRNVVAVAIEIPEDVAEEIWHVQDLFEMERVVRSGTTSIGRRLSGDLDSAYP
jgi:hypothetical protein